MNVDTAGTRTKSKGAGILCAVCVLCGAGGFTASGIAMADGEPPALAASAPERKTITFTGRIERLELEGGFWGVITDDGQKLDPGTLPQSMQVDGLRVQGRAQPLTDVMTIRMWGTPVELLEIEPAP